MRRWSSGALFVVSLLAAPAALCAEPRASDNPPGSHQLEALAEAGLAWPARTSHDPNVGMGLNTTASVLYSLGRGCAVGMFIDWTRLPWTPEAGPAAHVDTLMYGPEFRATLNRRGRVLPHVYVGWGLQNIYPSRKSFTMSIEGSSGIHAGIGLDVRVLQQLRVGISAGFVMAAYQWTSTAMYVPGDPGVPDGGWNVWVLRIGARGEFL